MTKNGAALPAVLMALAISSALAIGGAYVSRRAAATTRSRITLERLSDAVEISIGSMVASWDTSAWSKQPQALTVSDSVFTVEVETGTWVTRLTNSTYWVAGESCRRESPRICRRQVTVVVAISGSPIIAYGQPWSDLP